MTVTERLSGRTKGAVLVALLLVLSLTTSLARSDIAKADDEKDTTSAKKLAEVEQNGPNPPTSLLSVDFYLDAVNTAPFGGSYSDVLLSSGWDTSCGFFACGRTVDYEYTRTVWYGSTPFYAYQMQLNNKWVQSGLGFTSASCSIGYPAAVSCTVSGTTSKTVTKTGPVWNTIYSIYNEFFAGTVDFDDFTALGSLTETASSMVCHYVAQCQFFQASDTGP